MPEEIKRGRTMSLVLLGAVSIIFVVNVFYPLYLGPPDQSKRIAVLFMMIALAALAFRGVPSMRIIISGVLFILALVNILVVFNALSVQNFRVSIEVGSIAAGFLAIGWLLLFSKSVRAFETARQKRRA